MTAADDEPHSQCAAVIKAKMQELGRIEVNVSERRPGMQMPSDLDELSMTCPHGIPMWAEPTTEWMIANRICRSHQWGEWQHEDYLGNHCLSFRECEQCGEVEVVLPDQEV